MKTVPVDIRKISKFQRYFRNYQEFKFLFWSRSSILLSYRESTQNKAKLISREGFLWKQRMYSSTFTTMTVSLKFLYSKKHSEKLLTWTWIIVKFAPFRKVFLLICRKMFIWSFVRTWISHLSFISLGDFHFLANLSQSTFVHCN